jgi:hypothetical protein
VPAPLLTDPAEETTPLTGLPRTPGPGAEAGTETRPESSAIATLLADRPHHTESTGEPAEQAGTAATGVPDTAPVARPEATEPTAEPTLLPDGRPALPRRSRQAKVAPRPEVSDVAQTAATARPRSAEQARDLMSAIENGTRQGRKPLPAAEAGAGNPAADGASPDEQEG